MMAVVKSNNEWGWDSDNKMKMIVRILVSLVLMTDSVTKSRVSGPLIMYVFVFALLCFLHYESCKL